MPRILISYFSGYGESNYDAITNGFLEQGNDVLRINWLHVLKYKKSWGETSLQDNEIRKKIISFNPDLVMDYNHSLPLEFIEIFSCPICVLDADSPEAFWNKEYLRINRNKYCFLGGGLHSKKLFEDFFKSKTREDQYLYFPTATIMKKEETEYKRNIFFIGSNWFGVFSRKNTVEESDILSFFYQKYKQDFAFDKAKATEEYLKLNPKVSKEFVENYCNDDFKWHMAGQERMKHLSVLTDLGLEVYGTNWKTVAFMDFELAKNSVEGVISDTEEVSKLYNSSKISVNISHPQAKGGFSWRVMDIMASNSCLLMERKESFLKLFGEYLSKEVQDVIIYDDRYDMRQKAIKLLSDEELRLRCVKECNNAIEQNGRWKHRLRTLEDFLKIKLFNENNNPEYIFIKKIAKTNKETLKERVIKANLMLFIYLIMFCISFIPLFGRLFKRHKLLQKITSKMGQLT